MKRTSQFLRHSISREDRADGAILLRSTHGLGPVVDKTSDWLHRWAKEAPDRVFLAERSGAGWREESYSSTLQKVRLIAQSLLARGMGADTPILIMSGNGVDHGLLALAAQYIGVPVAPVAEQYSLIHGAHGRLRQAIELLQPTMAYVVDADQYGEALKLDALDGVEIVASEEVYVSGDDRVLRSRDGGDDARRARRRLLSPLAHHHRQTTIDRSSERCDDELQAVPETE